MLTRGYASVLPLCAVAHEEMRFKMLLKPTENKEQV